LHSFIDIYEIAKKGKQVKDEEKAEKSRER
jgi:hypothetical protein